VNAVHTVTQADEAAEDSARSPGDLLPALGSVPLGMHTRALAPAVCAVEHNPSPTDTQELTAAIGPILTGRTDTLLSALMT
jgi:hypothetical protein